ncbi:MAG TPA: zinc ribbon domain-containing protein [Lysobacter sp.]|nr:zinc ribbon domain-containing protein [Lysobacter sp.]
MPIYAFECAACGHSFERLQRLSDADPSQCPQCDAEAIRRQLTAPQFRLAGGGWYETDFKKDGDKKRNLAGEGGESKPGSGAEQKPTGGKSESKSEATAAAQPAEATPGATPAKAEPAAKSAAAKPAAGPGS